MPKKVQSEDIVLMNDLYLKIGTYAGVAREVGFAPGTVKRYIIEGYKPKEEVDKDRVFFDNFLPEIDSICIPAGDNDDWLYFCELSEEEIIGCKELQKELLI